MKHWLLQSLIALDQFFNAFFCGGWADETLSSRAYREYPSLAKIIDVLLWFDPEHCKNSYMSEAFRAQLPPEFRK